jgi:hypothetical protein
MIISNIPPNNSFRVWCEARTMPDCVRHVDVPSLNDLFKVAHQFTDFNGQQICTACTQNYHQYPELYKKEVAAHFPKPVEGKRCDKHGPYITKWCSGCRREIGLRAGNAFKEEKAKNDPEYYHRISRMPRKPRKVLTPVV